MDPFTGAFSYMRPAGTVYMKDTTPPFLQSFASNAIQSGTLCAMLVRSLAARCMQEEDDRSADGAPAAIMHKQATRQ